MSLTRIRFTRARIRALLLAGLLAACSQEEEEEVAAVPAPAPAVDATVYEGARLIVGNGTPAIETGTFVVSDGRFTEVGMSGEVTVPEGAQVVDLRGTTVMPMVIDTHVHLNRERDALLEDLRSRARFGVSAAMSLGQDTGNDVYQVQGEVIPGAALYRTAGRGITMPEPGRSDIPHWVNNEEEARAAVREEAELGVDIIKIWVDDRDGAYEKMPPEIYSAVIDEAHQQGLRVTAHIFNLEDAKGLLRAGVDAFAHGIRDTDVDDEAVGLFRERPDVVLVPNLPDPGLARDMSWLRGSIPEEQLEQVQAAAVDRPQAQEAYRIQARNLARLASAGVRIALGTDGNTPYAAHLEMEDMVGAGMTPMDVITAATRNSADFLQLEDSGTIEAGNSADFIVLDANPLEDITNTRRMRAVYLRGGAVER